MPTRHRAPMITACARLLPALLLPGLLLASTTAEAALTISNGFLTQKFATLVGFDFTLGLHATLIHNGVSRPTAIELTCSVDTGARSLACDGDLGVQGTTAAIRMDYDDDTGVASWSIAAGAPTILNVAHAQWGEEVVPNAMGCPPPGWSAVDFFAGGQWRKFYYSSSWARTFQEITGLPYSTVTDIWTW
jgi:hypothetical protein